MLMRILIKSFLFSFLFSFFFSFFSLFSFFLFSLATLVGLEPRELEEHLSEIAEASHEFLVKLTGGKNKATKSQGEAKVGGSGGVTGEDVDKSADILPLMHTF